TPRCPPHSCVAHGTAAPGGRGAWGAGRLRSPAPVDRDQRTNPAAPPSDGGRRRKRDNRSTFLLAAVPMRVSSFRLLPLPCRYGMLVRSDCSNNKLRDATGVKRGE